MPCLPKVSLELLNCFALWNHNVFLIFLLDEGAGDKASYQPGVPHKPQQEANSIVVVGQLPDDPHDHQVLPLEEGSNDAQTSIPTSQTCSDQQPPSTPSASPDPSNGPPATSGCRIPQSSDSSIDNPLRGSSSGLPGSLPGPSSAGLSGPLPGPNSGLTSHPSRSSESQFPVHSRSTISSRSIKKFKKTGWCGTSCILNGIEDGPKG